MRRLFIVMTVLVAMPHPAAADPLSADAAFSAGHYAEAFREWSQAAAEGDASAMAALGTLYDTGNGVPQDFAQAFQWYRRAADAGSIRGMFNTGVMYDSGRGTPASQAEALRWYTRAAGLGHGRAAYNAGLLYRDGDGVPRDRAAAIRYFRMAANDGVQAARANLAALHVIEPLQPPRPSPAPQIPGPATPRPPSRESPPRPALDADELTIARLQKAVLTREPLDPGAVRELTGLMPVLEGQAGKDNRIAQYDVGYALENGYGVSRDPVRSYVYYLRATASPDPSLKTAALRGAAEVGKTLNAAQHAIARDMLVDSTP